MAFAPTIDKENVVVAADSSHMNKGEEVNISQNNPGLQRVLIGLGWDVPEVNEGQPVDLDAAAFLLNVQGRVRRDTDFVFYNNLETEDGGIRHLGDNTTGDGEGDDEKIHIDLGKIGYDIEKIAFSVTMHNAEERVQNFGLVKNAYIRILNEDTGAELARYDLTEDASSNNAIIFGELVRDLEGWKFKALGHGGSNGLYQIARDYGVNVAPP